MDINAAVHPRTEVPPLLNVPLCEIIDLLVETGERIRDPGNANHPGKATGDISGTARVRSNLVVYYGEDGASPYPCATGTVTRTISPPSGPAESIAVPGQP